MFNLIGGSVIPDSGKIILNNKDITLMPEYKRSRKIGRLFQDPMAATAPDMTILKNLALAGGSVSWLKPVRKKDRSDYAERLKELEMGLDQRLDIPCRLLSGGQRQSLALMMATVNPPDILLLDEHTAALDPGSAEKIMNLTDGMVRKNHLTCLMITHNMYQALRYGKRTLVMDEGKIVLDTSDRERSSYSVNDMLAHFRRRTGKSINDDEILLI